MSTILRHVVEQIRLHSNSYSYLISLSMLFKTSLYINTVNILLNSEGIGTKFQT